MMFTRHTWTTIVVTAGVFASLTLASPYWPYSADIDPTLLPRRLMSAPGWINDHLLGRQPKVEPTTTTTTADSDSNNSESNENNHEALDGVFASLASRMMIPFVNNHMHNKRNATEWVDNETDNVKGWLDRDTNGTSNKVILGLSLGLGGPFLIGLLLGIAYASPFQYLF